MKLPTILDKKKLNMKEVAQELIDGRHFKLDRRMQTVKEVLRWIKQVDHDIYIFDRHEPGFEDWDEDDYARNFSPNHFEPYGLTTKNYIVVHDYC